MIKSLSLLGSTVAATLAFTGAAHAAIGYERVGVFNEASADGSQPAHQHRIAVNQASGDIYTTDVIDDRVEVYTPGAGTATALTTFGTGVLTDPYGIAIDQSNGDVYVSDDNNIVKFTSDGAATPTFTQDNTFTSPGVTGPLAFDEASNQLLVADRATNTIRRYNADGTVPAAGATFDGSAGDGSPGAFAGLQDLAVDSTGDVIVVDATGEPGQDNGSVSRVERFGANGEWKATIGPVDHAVAVAVRPGSDQVLVSGNQHAVYIGAPPTVTIFTAAGTSLGMLPVDATYSIVTGIAADDGVNGRMYVATDNGDYRGGGPQYVYGPISVQIFAEFEIPPPGVVTGDAESLPFGANVSGTVDPNRSGTTWTFEYGTTASYGSQASASPPDPITGDDAVPVRATITGLENETTYHYRLTATNASGTSHGSDRTFTTRAGVAVAGRDTTRAYEQVSPVDKGGQDLLKNLVAQSTADGNAIAYPTSGAFPGGGTSLLMGYYVAHRSPEGWTSTQADVPQLNLAGFDIAPTLWFSDDLRSVVGASMRGLAPGAQERGSNLYLTDLSTAARMLVATSEGGGFFAQLSTPPPTRWGNALYQAATPDLSHFAFTANAPVIAGLTSNAQAYEFTDGQLRVVSRLPDGSVAPCAFLNVAFPSREARAMSADGRRIFFSVEDESACGTRDHGQLYMRVDGNATVPISVSHRAGATSEPVAAKFAGASTDGSIVYFISDEQLTDADAAGIYRYEVDNDELTLITPHEDYGGAQVSTVPIEVTADGSTMAFTTQNALTPDARTSDYNVYVYRKGRIVFLTGDGGTEVVLSPSGRYAAFSAGDASLSGLAGATQVYRTDLDTEETVCVSCVNGASSGGLGNLSSSVSHAPPRRVFDDGRVVFESTAALSPLDTNGKLDVYQYTGGTVRLITSGTLPENSYLRQVAADGRDVFFMTTDQLVRADTDFSSDLYDARVGGGIERQNEPPRTSAPCAGDSCQGRPTAPAAPGVIGSVTFTGPDDPPTANQLPAVGKVKVTKPKVVHGSTGTVRVTLPAAGRLAISGAGLKSVKRTVTKAGTVTVRLTLTAKARKSLARRTLKTRARLSFSPTGSAAQTATVPVTFEAKR